ncbi:MAG: hypothetical protein U0176_04125 [Bacteroidia bacterium]
MKQENLFRFVVNRPANLKKTLSRRPKQLFSHPNSPGERSLETSLAAAHARGASRNDILAIVNNFKDSEDYVTLLKGLSFDIRPLYDWYLENEHVAFSQITLRGHIETLYGDTIEHIAESGDFIRSYERVADTLLAETHLRIRSSAQMDELVVSHKLFSLIHSLHRGNNFLDGSHLLSEFVGDTTMVLANRTLPEPPAVVVPDEPEPVLSQGEQDLRDIRIRLALLSRAHKDLTRKALTERSLEVAVPMSTESPSVCEQINNMEPKVVRNGKQRFHVVLEDANLRGNTRLPRGMRLSSGAFMGLSTETRGIMSELSMTETENDPFKALHVMETEMHALQGQIGAAVPKRKFLKIGGVKLEIGKVKEAFGYSKAKMPADLWKSIFGNISYEVGIGDLLVVRQHLKAYELADFAHVENVLAGEKRERTHRRLNVREETTTEEQESSSSAERNLQTTERSEMQNEVSKTVNEQVALKGSLKVEGSYGPTIKFTAAGEASYATNVTEASKNAVSFSREVTEKTAETIQERVRSERKRRVLEEIEEINQHTINNEEAANGHIRGVYRWLNKVYEAQVFNYGQRMLYEFVMPEPAAFYLYAMLDNPPQEDAPEKPEPPMFHDPKTPGAEPHPLQPVNIDVDNYQMLAAQYNATNVPTPPLSVLNVSFTEKFDGTQGGKDAPPWVNVFRTGTIKIPEGYEAFGAHVAWQKSSHAEIAGLIIPFWGSFQLNLGDLVFNDIDSESMGVVFPRTFRKEMSVAIGAYLSTGFALGIDVACHITSEGKAKWQQAVYDNIMQAYQQQLSEYESYMSQKAIQAGIQIHGRNPGENRILEKEELKKLCIMALTGKNNIALDSFYNYQEPTIKFGTARKNGSYIRFFENAFEWGNMQFAYYPYFWGRKARWTSALHVTDPDPEFAEFIKAGAVRIQIPVRPGFEKAVAHFSQFGEIWNGNDAPLLNDELYVPVVNEIMANKGKLEDGVPYPEGSEPWEYVVPTSLVLLQNVEELPSIRDILSGDVVTI